MNSIFIFTLMVAISPMVAFAQTSVDAANPNVEVVNPAPVFDPPLEPVPETAPSEPDILDKTIEAFREGPPRREQSSMIGLLNYSPFDLIIPSKLGVTLGWLPAASTTMELEYLSASISAPFLIDELGSVSEKRISILRRSFGQRNSFNVFYGISYFDMSMNLGSELLSSATGAGSLDLMNVQGFGVTGGIGNRWTFAGNFTVSIDWFSWSQPLIVTRRENQITQYISNTSHRDAAERAFRYGSYFPRFAVAKLQAGMSF